jgi:hypothetical protein
MFESRTIREARAMVLLKRLFTVAVSVYLVIGTISAYRAFYQVRSLELQSPDVLREGEAITTNVVSYARGAVDVQIELVQEQHTLLLGFQRVHGNDWALFDPRTQHGTQTVVVTDDVLKRFADGKAIVRATATGRPQWGRLPPPLVREKVITIQRTSTH